MTDRANITKSIQAADRRRRLAAELRANLGKRKQQARAREQQERAPMHQVADNSSQRDD